ncbi:hypothetical protein SAMN02990966_03401 [Rhodospirillales bacterium URHD0017]|nr:hypothetical protein SAMN02990966_03401 [Rhodospirillales bacterium URHD0017]
MTLNLSQISQIEFADVDRSEAFYEQVIGLRNSRSVARLSRPSRISSPGWDDHDLWMAFFNVPDGHTLAPMQEAPKGYTPPT